MFDFIRFAVSLLAWSLPLVHATAVETVAVVAAAAAATVADTCSIYDMRRGSTCNRNKRKQLVN